MKILHYFLGFPPYRTGGLTKFACDLMECQLAQKNDVVAIWPGKINFFIKKSEVSFKRRKEYKGIENYEIINPLPVPLDEGIKDVDKFIENTEIKNYLKFLSDISPDVIHIHTLMGMHKEFIEAAKLSGIKTLFTTHDYFGICPKVVLVNNGKICMDDYNCQKCENCNLTALSIKKIKIMQSPFYRKIKNLTVIKYLRKRHRKKFFSVEEIKGSESFKIKTDLNKYKVLRKYYLEILKKIDLIHFNSSQTEKIYKKYIDIENYKTITITHKEIKDRRNIKKNESEKIRLTFLASTKPYKGFYLLKEVLDEIYKEKPEKFELNVFDKVNETSPYMNVYENGFNQEDLYAIFSNTDILLAPSLWYETFGYTVLEAISYGVPVIISNLVGAKDVVNGYGIIFDFQNKDELKDILMNLTKEDLLKIKQQKDSLKIKTWDEFIEEINNLYKL